MRLKAIAFLLFVGLSVLAYVAIRKDNRADAAQGNCYSATDGPATPTVCN